MGYIIVREDIPFSLRNKLYVQLNRRMEQELERAETGTNVVPLAVLEKYKDVKDSRGKKIIMYKNTENKSDTIKLNVDNFLYSS